MSPQYGKDEWVRVVDCYQCKKQTPTKETHRHTIPVEYFGVKGYIYVEICKECNRDHQLNKLIHSL